MRGKPVTDEERARILALAVEGKSYQQIARETGRPMGTICRAVSDGILVGAVPRRRDWFTPRAFQIYNRLHGR